MSYRLAWDRNICSTTSHWSGKNCYNIYLTGNVSVVRVKSYFNGYKLQYITGNVTTETDFSDLFYTDIGVFHEVPYETGSGSTTLINPNGDTANTKIR